MIILDIIIGVGVGVLIGIAFWSGLVVGGRSKK